MKRLIYKWIDYEKGVGGWLRPHGSKLRWRAEKGFKAATGVAGRPSVAGHRLPRSKPPVRRSWQKRILDEPKDFPNRSEPTRRHGSIPAGESSRGFVLNELT